MSIDKLGPSVLEATLVSEAETENLGRALARLVEPGTVIGLIGPLGAGKTRLSRAIAEALGVDPAAISSPTFMLINEYNGILPVYHFDAYRLPSADAFDDLGSADYWNAGGVCLVEWADRVLDRLPGDAWTIRFEPIAETERRLRIELPARPDLTARLSDSLSRV